MKLVAHAVREIRSWTLLSALALPLAGALACGGVLDMPSTGTSPTVSPSKGGVSGKGGDTGASGGASNPSTGGTSTGGVTATGGAVTGGKGGAAASGGTFATGGSATGGAATGGRTGGSATGGAATGGRTGGSSTGGTAAGGKGGTSATGGITTGGTATGGTATGGTATGGAGGAKPGESSTAQRPAYNKSTGFFVAGNKLYDANGNEFRIRGLNHLHWDNQSVGIPKTGANTERWDLDFKKPIATNMDLMHRSIGNKLVPMPGNWEGTCKQETSYLTTIVDEWIANVADWKTVEKYLLLNIANEWGPEKSTVWRDGYIEAIKRLRNAGFNSTIVVDAGGCGQDDQTVVLYGNDVFNSDPQKNVVFDIHIYGGWQMHPDPAQWWLRDINKAFDGMAATGLPIFVGEFGPGRDIGPSPTMLTPGEVITAAESHGFGWLAWAWDDPAGEYTSPPRDDWFALSFTGDYVTSADLTTFGKEVIENPVYGLKVLGKRASIF